MGRVLKAVASGGSTGRAKIIVDHMQARIDPDLSPLDALKMEWDGVI